MQRNSAGTIFYESTQNGQGGWNVQSSTALALVIGWHESPRRTIYSFIPPRGFLTRPGFANYEGDHSMLYPGFPELARL